MITRAVQQRIISPTVLSLSARVRTATAGRYRGKSYHEREGARGQATATAITAMRAIAMPVDDSETPEEGIDNERVSLFC